MLGFYLGKNQITLKSILQFQLDGVSFIFSFRFSTNSNFHHVCMGKSSRVQVPVVSVQGWVNSGPQWTAFPGSLQVRPMWIIAFLPTPAADWFWLCAKFKLLCCSEMQLHRCGAKVIYFYVCAIFAIILAEGCSAITVLPFRCRPLNLGALCHLPVCGRGRIHSQMFHATWRNLSLFSLLGWPHVLGSLIAGPFPCAFSKEGLLSSPPFVYKEFCHEGCWLQVVWDLHCTTYIITMCWETPGFGFSPLSRFPVSQRKLCSNLENMSKSLFITNFDLLNH